jgi:predicted DCC family thiol-disulfide oxidoreductase YuxK
MSQAYSYRLDPTIPSFPDEKPLFIYDGHCVLCSGWVQTVLRLDKKGRFRMLAAQSPLGQAIYVHYGLDPVHHDTNLVLLNGVAYTKSRSSIIIVASLGFPWTLARVGLLVPRAMLDRLYELVARNRIRWFGKHEHCMLSLAGYETRFLTGDFSVAVTPDAVTPPAASLPGCTI